MRLVDGAALAAANAVIVLADEVEGLRDRVRVLETLAVWSRDYVRMVDDWCPKLAEFDAVLAATGQDDAGEEKAL